MKGMLAILFADLAGFTALTEAHGDQGAVDLVEQFDKIIRAALPPHAKLVKIVGDAAMIVAEVDDAPSLAVKLKAASEELPGRPALRVGIHAGDVIERKGDYWGHVVNVAARVARQAGPGEILLTEVVRDRIEAAAPELAAQLDSIGDRRLRNVSRSMTLFSLTTKESELYTDPICRMRMKESESIGRRVLDGQTHRFCSSECLASFLELTRDGQS